MARNNEKQKKKKQEKSLYVVSQAFIQNTFSKQELKYSTSRSDHL